MYDHGRGKTDREPVKDAYFLYEAVKNQSRTSFVAENLSGHFEARYRNYDF